MGRELTRSEKIKVMIDSGLADDRSDAIAQLVDMGEIEDDEDDEPSEFELERIAENVGIPFWERVDTAGSDEMFWLGGM